jgi:hypothetical protein
MNMIAKGFVDPAYRTRIGLRSKVPWHEAGNMRSSDVDGMVIGRAGLADLSPALRKAAARLGREVNVTAYSPEEFWEKIKSRDHFLAGRFTREETVSERRSE